MHNDGITISTALHTYAVLNKEGQVLGHVDCVHVINAMAFVHAGDWHDERDAGRTEPLLSREPVSLRLEA